jgi:tRNA nucleotidyltransferase (CCA-adding enzyme)
MIKRAIDPEIDPGIDPISLQVITDRLHRDAYCRAIAPARIYCVGGAVRDLLLGRTVHDHDWLVVGSSPQQMLDAGFLPVGRDFPVFLHPQNHEEFALARTERKIARGYHGFAFYSSPEVSLEEDLKRRDLRINAMAIDSQGELHDPYQGRIDLRQRLLRHISDAFREDPVRLLRVARFAARFPSFQVHPQTMQMMRDMVRIGETDHWTAERVWRELNQGMAEIKPSALWRCLAQCELDPFHRLSEDDQAMLMQLDAAAAAGLAQDLRWGVFCALASETLREPVLASLKMPRDQQALCKRVLKHQSALRQILCSNHPGDDAAQRIASLFESMDLMRRPQQLDELVAVMRWHPDVHAQSLNRQNRAIAALQTLAEVFRDQKAAAKVFTSGLQGPALGEALKKARALALSEALQSRYSRGLHDESARNPDDANS